MIYDLPKTVELHGKEVPIRYDFRVILDIFEALNEKNADLWERNRAALYIFYPDYPIIPGAPQYSEAIQEMYKFINGGKSEEKPNKGPQLVSWDQDFSYICAAVNRIIGQDIRGIPYDKYKNTGGLHWFTFLSAYMEIGDCLFSQIVSIRSKQARGTTLSKSEAEFYKRNKELITIKREHTEKELKGIRSWI